MRASIAFVRLVVLGVAIACGGSDATKPPGGPPQATTPVVTAVTAGLTALPGTQTVRVSGTGFGAGPTVTFTAPSGATATFAGAQISAASATSLTVSATLAEIGGWGVEVANADGRRSNAFSFSVARPAAPAVTAVSPSAIDPAFTPQTITVTGSAFQAGLSAILTFSNGSILVVPSTLPANVTPNQVTKIESVTATSFSLTTVFAGRVGVSVRVVNPDGQASATPGQLTVGEPITPSPLEAVPSISALTPVAPGVYPEAQVLRLTGTAFDPTLAAFVTNPAGVTVVYSLSSDIRVLSPTSANVYIVLNQPGTWRVAARNLLSAQSTPVSFTVAPVPTELIVKPRITALTSPTPKDILGEQTLVFSGVGFRPGMTAALDYSGNRLLAAPATVGATTATSVEVKADFAIAGPWTLTLTTPEGATAAIGFQVAADNAPAPAPTIAAAGPTPLAMSLGFQRIDLTGANFRDGMTATIDGPPALIGSRLPTARVDVITSTKANLFVSSGLDVPGTWRVSLTNPGGTTSAPFDLVAQYPPGVPPVITSLDPPQPYLTFNDQTVTLRGTGFRQGLRLYHVTDAGLVTRIFGSGATEISVPSATAFSVPVRLTTRGSFVVQNPDGRVSAPFAFTLTSAPPRLFAAGVGAGLTTPTPRTVSLSGSDLQAGMTLVMTSPTGVTVPVSGVVVNGTTSASGMAVVNEGGTWRIQATNPDGKASNILTFSAFSMPAPAVALVAPAGLRSADTPQLLTLQGTGFAPGMRVELTQTVNNSTFYTTAYTFLGSAIQSLTPTSAQVSPVLFPAGTWNVTVTNPEGLQGRTIFTVAQGSPAPTVTAVTPTDLTANASRQLVTVRGSGFHPGLDVVVTDPTGKELRLTLAPTVNLDLTSFQTLVAFTTAGTWKLSVVNLDGQASVPITVVVH